MRRLRRAGVGEVAIERGDGQVVDTLLDAGLTVVVISPNQVHNLRGRYGSAGNKDDRFDAFVLADTLRTDRARLRPLIPDTPATVLLRSTVRARKDLLTHRVGLANQLRAHLRFFHPGPVGLFADLDAVTSLRFLARFACQDDADWLTPSRLATWLRSVGYTGRKDPAALHAHLLAAAPGATGPAGAAAASVTGAFVAALTAIVAQIHALDAHIAALLGEHADAHIFLSLPARASAARGPAAGRDRGLPRPVPHPRIAGLAGRGHPVDAAVREDEDHLVPLVGRQAAARRGLRLRRRLPPRQPLGRGALRAGHRPRAPPSARRADPGPRLAARDLAVLAGPPALRPRPPPRTPGAARTNPATGEATAA